MDKKKPNTLQTIFELTEIRYADYETDETGEFIAPKYPEFKVHRWQIGVFSTLAKAEQAMKEFVDSCCEVEILGFHIDELYIDSIRHFKTIRNYLSDGSLWDECLTSSLEDDEGCSEEFLGRPADKVRFQNGDLAEELCGNVAHLVMVGNPPLSPEEISKRKQRPRFADRSADYMDDLYYTLHFCEEDFHPDGYRHSHPFPTNLFPVRFPVSDEIRNNLESHYRNYRSWYE